MRKLLVSAALALVLSGPAYAANIIRPTPGSINAYAACGFTLTDFNSLASGSAAVATTAISQSTNLDDYLSVSFSVVVGGTTTSASYLSLYILPLNQDGTTYGDGTVTGSTAPSTSYWVTNVTVPSGVASGTAVVGTFPAVFIGNMRQNFRVAIVNNLGVALNATASAVVDCNTTNTNGNG